MSTDFVVQLGMFHPTHTRVCQRVRATTANNVPAATSVELCMAPTNAMALVQSVAQHFLRALAKGAIPRQMLAAKLLEGL